MQIPIEFPFPLLLCHHVAELNTKDLNGTPIAQDFCVILLALMSYTVPVNHMLFTFLTDKVFNQSIKESTLQRVSVMCDKLHRRV